MYSSEGVIQGSLGELGAPVDNPVIERLGGLGVSFSLAYAHGDDFSEYHLNVGDTPLSPESTHGLLYDSLHQKPWNVRDTSAALQQMLNRRGILYRRVRDTYGDIDDTTLLTPIDHLMDVLDSTPELAWQHTGPIPVYDEASVIDALYALLPRLDLRTFNRLWTDADLPDLPYKRLKRRPSLEQETRMQWIGNLMGPQQDRLFDVMRKDLFAGFSSVTTDTPPDATIDRSGTLYIANSDLPDECTPATVSGIVVGPATAKVGRSGHTSNDTAATSHGYHVDFRTTRTFYTARPVLSWMTSDQGREFLLQRTAPEKDVFGETGTITAPLLGMYIAAGLCESSAIDNHINRFPRRYQAAATVPPMALHHANDILSSVPLVHVLEQKTSGH